MALPWFQFSTRHRLDRWSPARTTARRSLTRRRPNYPSRDGRKKRRWPTRSPPRRLLSLRRFERSVHRDHQRQRWRIDQIGRRAHARTSGLLRLELTRPVGIVKCRQPAAARRPGRRDVARHAVGGISTSFIGGAIPAKSRLARAPGSAAGRSANVITVIAVADMMGRSRFAAERSTAPPSSGKTGTPSTWRIAPAWR